MIVSQVTGDITLGDLILLNHRAKINRQVKIKTLFKEHLLQPVMWGIIC